MSLGKLVLLCALVLSFTNALKPFYGWSQKIEMGVEAKKELTEQISSTQLALEIKAILDSDKAFSAVLYMWPNFESETLANQIATNYNQIHTLIKSVSQKQLERSFPDVSEGVAQALTEAFPESVKVKIDSKEAFDNLIQDI